MHRSESHVRAELVQQYVGILVRGEIPDAWRGVGEHGREHRIDTGGEAAFVYPGGGGQDPCVYSKHMVIPKPGTDFTDPAAFASVGMTVTGLPALNAIRSVIDAPPGILTSADLPLRGFAGRFK